ncbi:MAG: hypothetical protein JXQ71_02215 [Verrucomicrobia bacterium]|nr:hypothetical protein [Verrucomicrobiota bacterium]
MKTSLLLSVVFGLAFSGARAANPQPAAPAVNTKVYTLFLSRGYGGAGEPPQAPLTNQELLSRLQSECEGMEFITRDLSSSRISHEEIENDLRNRTDIDGVLIIGTTRHYTLAFTGRPTIVVYNLFEWMNIPYQLYSTGAERESVLTGGPVYTNARILTAQLDRRRVCSAAKGEAMFKDLVYKIKLIQVIQRLKASRILVVSPHETLAAVDYQGDVQKRFPKDYNDRYIGELKASLGVELAIVKPQEFYQAYQEASVKDAEAAAQPWIDQAREVTAAKSEIVKTARAYLAFEALREKYHCNAVSTHLRSLSASGGLPDAFWPGLGLECGFKVRGIQAVCQNYPNIVVAQLMGYFLTGRPSMLGDLMIDTENSVDILTHCGAPINPYGDERRVPYSIKTHAESPVKNTQQPGSSTGLQVEWPAGETVTFWKVYVLHRKIGVHTGRIVDGHSLYKNLDDIMCRTKLVAEVDAAKVQKHFSPDEYGIHRNATLGDLRQQIKDLAVLIGFQVVEEDR